MKVRRGIRIIIALGAVLTVVAGYYAYGYAAVGTAYAAHIMCSGVFVSGRNPASLLESDLSADDLVPLRAVRTHVDMQSRRVGADVLGLASRTAVYRDGSGCVLSDGDRPAPSDVEGSAAASTGSAQQRGPDEFDDEDDSHGDAVRIRFARVLEWAFAEPDPVHLRRTRAVVIVHDGRLVAERYAGGFNRNTPLIGWSMAKSVVNALAGILVKEGRMSLDAPIAAAAWPPGDLRRDITLNHLLRMSSGLHFDEDSINPRGDILRMLLDVPDVPAFAAAQDLEAVPGARWEYSSATTNIITGAMRRAVGEAEYPTFPKRALFDRIGMNSAVIETDPRGNFIGSSFMYATARDWARFGLLYLNDGQWHGERILPEGWVAYSRTPAPAAPHREYGAHFWLQVADEYRGAATLPPDTFHAAGHEGQFISIVPSQKLVVVRLGLTRSADAWQQDEFVKRVLDALAK